MFCKTALILTVLSLLVISTLMATTTPNSSTAIQKMSQMPLAFTKNMGQWNDRVLFRASVGGATMWFTKEGVTYQFTRRVDTDNTPPVGPVSRGDLLASTGADPNAPIPLLRAAGGVSDRDSIEQLILTAKFVGANPNPEAVAEGQMEYKCNYFLGNDPTKWHTDVPNYEAITLKDIYPGIDLKYSGDNNGQAAYEFIAVPSADIAQIKVEYEGAEETSIDSDGRLILKTKWGDMVATDPATKSTGLASPRFVANAEHALGFAADGQNLAQANSGTLTLSYSTYLGGGGGDGGYGGVAVDSSGNAYVTGSTYSSDFPTSNPYQTDQGSWDVFVTKLSCTSDGLIYSTYLGGGSDDWGEGIAVDDSGNAYVTGSTWSSDLPTLSSYQTDQGGVDAFVTKLSSSGNSLIYSTYLGGESYDEGQGIAVDGSGGAYVTGSTQSSDFPALNPIQTFQGYNDVFVTKLSSSGNSLAYSTCLGGGSEDYGWDIAVDDSDNAYVTGRTSSSDFPTLNPYQTYQGSVDAFVAKLSSSGSSLIYSTYLGGSGAENEYDSDYHMGGIAVDDNGNVYVMGSTYSSDFPTLNPYQAYQGNIDVFMTEFSSTGNSLIYSTYLGGSGNDWGEDIAIDGSGNAYVTGVTYSSDFPTENPYQTYQGSNDAFVTKLSKTGNSLIYSTYLGGGDGDAGWGLAVDGSGNAYVTGSTLSYDFPTLNPYQMYQFWDAFVTKLSWTPDYICGDADGEGTINIADVVYLIAYIFSGGPAPNPLASGDADCGGDINIADCVYLISYIFSGGPQPCTGCK